MARHEHEGARCYDQRHYARDGVGLHRAHGGDVRDRLGVVVVAIVVIGSCSDWMVVVIGSCSDWMVVVIGWL